MIEELTGFPENVVAVACKGRVTRQDYETTLIPLVEKALEGHEKVRLYYEIGAGFEGIEPGAMWEDFKVGMEHLLRWERVAVVTDIDWIGNTIRFFGIMIPGAVKIFPTADMSQARDWVVAA